MKQSYNFVTLSICVMLTLNGLSQTSDDPSVVRWTFNPGMGIDIPLTQLKTGMLTDELVHYSNQAFYYQPLLSGIYWNEHWGVDVIFQIRPSTVDDKGISRIEEFIQDSYGSSHFIYDQSKRMDRHSINERPLIGLCYRIQRNRWLSTAKMYVGSTSIQLNGYTFDLKEHNTNLYKKVTFEPKEVLVEPVTWAFGLSQNYYLTKRLSLRFDMMYSFFKSNFELTETHTNLFTTHSDTKIYSYNKGIHNLSLGIGLTVDVYRR
jgi:hypothetical protein